MNVYFQREDDTKYAGKCAKYLTQISKNLENVYWSKFTIGTLNVLG